MRPGKGKEGRQALASCFHLAKGEELLAGLMEVVAARLPEAIAATDRQDLLFDLYALRTLHWGRLSVLWV